ELARINIFSLPPFRGIGAGDLAARLLLLVGLRTGVKRFAVETPAEYVGFFKRFGFSDGTGEPSGRGRKKAVDKDAMVILESNTDDIIFPRRCDEDGEPLVIQ
ncbi:MAG: hypothetical protein FWD16_01845, partial [Clostridia bacterium]|nr:hypothetical protein [Clostridia bacterium]